MNNIFEIKLDIYESISKSSTPTSQMTLQDVFSIIKDNPEKEKITTARQSGKDDSDKVYKIYREGKNVDVNFYEYVKTKLQCVCFSAQTKSTRNLNSELDFTGLMYIDIDDFQKTVENTDCKDVNEAILYVENNLKNIPSVVSIWKSYGGSGLGVLMAVSGLNKDNYKSTWEYIAFQFETKGIYIDASVKDIIRLNVISYDENIYVSEEEEIVPFPAIQPKVKVTYQKAPTYTTQEQLSIIKAMLNKRINNLSYRVHTGAYWRLNYGFFQSFFCATNRMGIPVDTVMDVLEELSNESEYEILFNYRTKSDVYTIALKQYRYYANQYGLIQVEEEITDEFEAIKYNETIKVDSNSIIKFAFSFYKKDTGYLPKHYRMIINYLKQRGLTKDVVANAWELMDAPEEYLKEYDNPKINFGSMQLNEGMQIERIKEYIRVLNDKGHTASFNVLPKENVFEILDQVDSYGKHTSMSSFEAAKHLHNKGINWFEVISEVATISREIAFNLVELNNVSPETFGVDIKYSFKHKDFYDFPIAQRINLKPNQMISDVKIPRYNKTILWGDTNIGKTTFVCQRLKTKRIVLLPIVAAIETLSEKYPHADVYYGKKKKVNPNSKLILCTYDSFFGLCDYMENNPDMDTKDYVVYLDEYHTMVTNSSYAFKGHLLNEVVNNLHKFARVVAMTATLLPHLHKFFNDAQIIRVRKPRTEVSYTVEYTDNRYVSVEKNLIRGKLNVIYLQNKDKAGRLGKLLSYLRMKGWYKVGYINSQTKNTPLYKDLVSTEYVDTDKYDVIICTSAIIEALNIKNEDVGSLQFMSNEHPALMEQLYSRFRVVKPSKVVVYMGAKHYGMEYSQFTSLMAQKRTIKVYDALVRKLAIGRNLGGITNLFNLTDESESLYGSDGEIYIDYLNIANKGYVMERNLACKSLKMLRTLLSEYNWTLEKVIQSKETLDDNGKKNMEEAVQRAKRDELSTNETLVRRFSKVEDYEFDDFYRECSKYYMPTYTLFFKRFKEMRTFMSYDQAKAAMIEIYSANNVSKAWSAYMNSLSMYLLLCKGNDDLQKAKEMEVIKKIYEKFNGKDFTEKEMRRILARNFTHIDWTSTDAIMFLKQYLFIEETKVHYNVQRYKFRALDVELDTLLFVQEVYEVLTKHTEQGVLDVNMLIKAFKHISKKYVLYATIKWDNKKVLQFIRRFVDCKRFYDRKEKRNLYKITGDKFDKFDGIELCDVPLYKLKW